MRNQDYSAKLPNLEDVMITNVESVSEELHINIEQPRKAHTCPVCELSSRHDLRLFPCYLYPND